MNPRRTRACLPRSSYRPDNRQLTNQSHPSLHQNPAVCPLDVLRAV